MGLKFTWSPAKAKRNLTKHRVSFDAAKLAFADPHLVIVDDCEDEFGEMRYHAIGYGGNPNLLLTVVFADRSTDEEEILHIISARKAEDYEQKTYARSFTEGD